jgi:hypothetical protein
MKCHSINRRYEYMSETHIHRAGIVDRVAAKRRSSEVVSLAVTVRFETMLANEYAYNNEQQVDEVTFHVPPSEGVNPGDVVIMNISFKNPFGQRFVPALEVGNPADELDEDALAEAAAERDDIDVDA